MTFGTILTYGGIAIGTAAISKILEMIHQPHIAQVLHIVMYVFLAYTAGHIVMDTAMKILVKFGSLGLM